MKHGFAVVDGKQQVPIIIDHSAPPCDQSCATCDQPCPTYESCEDGVYESPFQLVPGFRHFMAIRSGRAIAAGEVPMGHNADRVIDRLEFELNARPPSLKLI